MSKLDGYVLRACFRSFGFFSIVLVLIAWVNRTVNLLEALLTDGHSARAFIEISVLTLPTMMHLILPLSTFAAALYASNQLINDREMTTLLAAGLSPWRIARPFLWFGLCVALTLGVLSNALIPASRAALNEKTALLSENLIRQYLRGGQFVTPSDGITLFIREINAAGEMQDVFMADSSHPASELITSAPRGTLVKSAAGSELLLFDGTIQRLTTAEQELSRARFATLSYNLNDIFGIATARVGNDIGTLSTRKLISANPAVARSMDSTPFAMRREGHMRIAQPLLALGSPLIGFAALMLGGFSRFGIWRQIGLAIALAIIVHMLNTQGISSTNVMRFGWPIIYLGPFAALVCGFGLIGYVHINSFGRRQSWSAI